MKQTPKESTPLKHQCHAKPRSRRELLGQGFMMGSTGFFAPSLLSLFSQQAIACDLANIQTAAKQSPAVMMFDLAGGGSTCGGNVCVGKLQNQIDTAHFGEEAWRKLGHVPATRYNADGANVDYSLGLPFVSNSPILAGIKSRASAGTLAKGDGAVFCTRSANDTNNNIINPMFGLLRAGVQGTIVPSIANAATPFAGRSKGPYGTSKTPVVVNNAQQARRLLDGVSLIDLMQSDKAQVGAYMQAATQLAKASSKRFNLSNAEREAFGCVYDQAERVLSAFSNLDVLDPSLDADINTIFGNPFQKDAAVNLTRAASAAKLIGSGYAGLSMMEMPSFDYHDGTRTTGDKLDFELGECIGATAEYCLLKGRPLFVYIFSDGSVSGGTRTDETGKLIWQADSAETSGSILLYFSPEGRIGFKKRQLGAFTAFGSNDTNFLIGSSQVASCDAVTLNYLALQNRLSEFSQLMPDATISASDYDALLLTS